MLPSSDEAIMASYWHVHRRLLVASDITVRQRYMNY